MYGLKIIGSPAVVADKIQSFGFVKLVSPIAIQTGKTIYETSLGSASQLKRFAEMYPALVEIAVSENKQLRVEKNKMLSKGNLKNFVAK